MYYEYPRYRKLQECIQTHSRRQESKEKGYIKQIKEISTWSLDWEINAPVCVCTNTLLLPPSKQEFQIHNVVNSKTDTKEWISGEGKGHVKLMCILQSVLLLYKEQSKHKSYLMDWLALRWKSTAQNFLLFSKIRYQWHGLVVFFNKYLWLEWLQGK